MSDREIVTLARHGLAGDAEVGGGHRFGWRFPFHETQELLVAVVGDR